MRSAALFGLLAALVTLSGCHHRKRTAVPAPAGNVKMTETGVASWYGHPYHGRASSSGEVYDMEKMTAAHRTLPFGTEVRVLNLANQLTVDVRINDRGPFVDGRIIDLSRAAARQIQMLGPGTAKVKLEVLKLAPGSPDDYFAVQIGAFRDRANAERQRAAFEKSCGSARLMRRDGDTVLWRVWVGREPTREGADALAARLRGENENAFVVRVDRSSDNFSK